jgi:hypothetical protein
LETSWFGYQGYTGLIVESDELRSRDNEPIIYAQSNTGCQGPYVNGVAGTGGFGADCCPCKCCPPPCCASVCAEFVCGNQAVPGHQGSPATDPIVMEDGLTCIVMEDGTTFIGQEDDNAKSSFAATFCIVPGTPGVCCIEYLGGAFRAVGNGYVTYTGSAPDDCPCGNLTVRINGSIPPVYVTDGTSLSLTVVSEDPSSCPCSQVGTSNPCGLSMRMAAVMRNDKIILDRKAVVQKVAAVRRQKMQQKMRMLRSSPS